MKKWMKLIRGSLLLLPVFSFALILTACQGKQNGNNSNGYNIAYLNQNRTAIEYMVYETDTIETTELIDELIGQLGDSGGMMGHSPISGDVELQGYTYKNGKLVMNFSEAYKQQSTTDEVLNRAAIVKTMTQLGKVVLVSFTINGDPLTNMDGTIVGNMSADSFLSNDGTGINAYETTKVRLYFTNEEGNKLIAKTRTVTYSGNISLEKIVLEQLILGPVSEEAYPTINPGTSIISTIVKDGICYVNLTEEFLEQKNEATPECVIYSIVDSLTELPNVNKVQISIGGETGISYESVIDLSTVFERDYTLIQQ